MQEISSLNSKPKLSLSQGKMDFRPLIAFAATLFFYLILALICQKYPFGPYSTSISDLDAQYAPFLALFRNRMDAGGSIMYSFDEGLGGKKGFPCPRNVGGERLARNVIPSGGRQAAAEESPPPRPPPGRRFACPDRERAAARYAAKARTPQASSGSISAATSSGSTPPLRHRGASPPQRRRGAPRA